MPSEWMTPEVYEILTHGVSQDLLFYEQLSHRHNGPILDLGAGLGRISTPLLHSGYSVVLLEHNPHMCSELSRRFSALPEDVQKSAWILKQDMTTHAALDVNKLEFGHPDTLPKQFAVVVLGLRTIHLFSESERRQILYLAKKLLRPGGVLSIHYSDLKQAVPIPSWTLVAEHPLESGTIEVEECFSHHLPSQQFHLRHRIWQSNNLGQHVGSWRVAHDLYAIDVQNLLSELSDIGFTDIENPPLHGTESFIIARV